MRLCGRISFVRVVRLNCYDSRDENGSNCECRDAAFVVGRSSLDAVSLRVLTLKIAMYWSTNPIGLSSICALIASVLAWLTAEAGFSSWKRSRNGRAILAPSLLLAFVAYLKVVIDSSLIGFGYHWGISRYADTPDLFACYIFVAVSIVLAWKAVRLAKGGLKILALTELFIAAGFLSLETFCTFEFMASAHTI